MCERLNGVQDLASAARALTAACACQLSGVASQIGDVAASLHRAFASEVYRDTPDDMIALLGRLSDPEPPAPLYATVADI